MVQTACIRVRVPQTDFLQPFRRARGCRPHNRRNGIAWFPEQPSSPSSLPTELVERPEERRNLAAEALSFKLLTPTPQAKPRSTDNHLSVRKFLSVQLSRGDQSLGQRRFNTTNGKGNRTRPGSPRAPASPAVFHGQGLLFRRSRGSIR